jgi:hypothetical protein
LSEPGDFWPRMPSVTAVFTRSEVGLSTWTSAEPSRTSISIFSIFAGLARESSLRR